MSREAYGIYTETDLALLHGGEGSHGLIHVCPWYAELPFVVLRKVGAGGDDGRFLNDGESVRKLR